LPHQVSGACATGCSNPIPGIRLCIRNRSRFPGPRRHGVGLYAYAWPTNPYCLHVDAVEDDVTHKIFGRFIYTDEPAPLRVTFQKRIEPDEMDAALYALMTKELAVAICMRVTEDLKRKNY